MSLLSAVQSHGQETTTPKNESRPSSDDDALVPLTSGPPLTAREEEMLRLIKGLQERVARLEAQGGSDDGDLKPAAQGDYTGTSQARLLEVSIVFLPSARVNEAMGAASLAVPTFHTSPNTNGSPRSAINPFDGTR